MADAAFFVPAQDTYSMPLMAHLEELRKRIIFSVLGVIVGFLACWSYADRIFGLVQQPLIRALHHHGLSGGLVYLNPTEPFNPYLEVGFVPGLFTASPFVFFNCGCSSLPNCIARKSVIFCRSYLAQLFVHCRRLFWFQDGLPGVAGSPNRIRPALPADDHDCTIYEVVFDNHHWSRPDLRNADSRVLSRLDAADYSSLDVARPALLHNRHFCCRGNGHTDYRHLEYVPLCRPDGRALCHQYWSGLAGEFGARTSTRRCLTCASCREREEKRPDEPYNRHRRSMYQSRCCRHSASLASFCCVPKRNR
jgi:hypothetical protein